MPGITRVGEAATKISGTGTGTAITTAMPSGTAAQDILILEVGDGLDTFSVSDPAGWTFLERTADAGTSPAEAGLGVWWKVATGSDSAPSLTSAGATRWHTLIRAFRGVDNTSPFIDHGVLAHTTASAAAHSGPGMTNTDANAWGIASLCTRQVATPYTATPGSGLTERIDQDNGVSGTTNVLFWAGDSNGGVATGSVLYTITASAASGIAVVWSALLRPASGPSATLVDSQFFPFFAA